MAVRVAGCVGWALCASITGVLFGTILSSSGSPPALRWCSVCCSGCRGRKAATAPSCRGAESRQRRLSRTAELPRMPRFWGFIVYVVSPASTTCLTSSSANFSKAFSPVRSAVPKCLASSPPASVQRADHALRAGHRQRSAPKRPADRGMIMSVRILGSSFASSAVEVILKMLHMFEIPSCWWNFKYISSAFNRASRPPCSEIGFNSSKQRPVVLARAGCTTPSASSGLSDPRLHNPELHPACIVRHRRGGNRSRPTGDAEPRLTPAPLQG